MKKFALIAAMLCLGFTGCDKKDAKVGGSGTASKTTTTTTTTGAGGSTTETKTTESKTETKTETTPPKTAPTGPNGTAK